MAMSMMNVAIEISNEGYIDQPHRLPQVMVDGKQYDLSNLCRKREKSKKRKKKTRKSLRKRHAEPVLHEKVFTESELGHRKLSERTEQRSNLSCQPRRPPIIVIDGEKYDLSNLSIPNTKKHRKTRTSLYPHPSQLNATEKGSVEGMCTVDQMIRNGKIFRSRVCERSRRPADFVVGGEQWDLSNLCGGIFESLYPEPSQLVEIGYDSAEKLSRLHQTIRKSEISSSRFRPSRSLQRQPPVLVVDGKEHDISNLCIPKQSIEDPESISLELPMESLHVQESPLHDKDAFRHPCDEQVWEAVDATRFPLDEICFSLPHAEVESVVTESSFASLDFSIRGPLQTVRALGKGCFACAECMEASKPLHCTDDADFILCPKCKCVGVKAYGGRGKKGRPDGPFPKERHDSLFPTETVVNIDEKEGRCDSPFPTDTAEVQHHRVLCPPSHYRLRRRPT
jgi:hypothetical protein